MSQPYSYRNPVLSLWQAAVADVHARRHSVKLRMATVTAQRLEIRQLAAPDDLMSPVHMIASAFSDQGHERNARLPGDALTALSRGGEVENIIVDCAKIVGKILVAEMEGDDHKVRVLRGELNFSRCDAGGWSECVTSYFAFKASGGDRPYRAGRNPVFDLDGKSRIAIIGDWGTGDEVAINLLQQVASFKPDVLIHLGDVYYAGTQHEQQANFLDVCRQVLGNDIPLFSLCGNHDMYSGGNGYYWLVDHIGQQASYFCLRNAAWQFLAMDTGHNDNDPLTVGSNMTSLMTVDGWSEADWHMSKIREAGDRKTVLLSHHQLFSPFGSVGDVESQPYAYNPALLANFQDVLPKIAWWFWGHEHTLAVYDPYMGVQRGRCLGASAVPVFTDQQSYENASGLQTYQGAPLPTWNPKGVLGDNGTDYAHGFAIMTLNGPSATVEYYQVPVLGTASRLLVTDAV